jgi:S1-C subfamily serine protease
MLLQSVASLGGSFARGSLRVIPPLRVLDSVGGLIAGAALGLALVWVAAAVLLQIPGRPKVRDEVLSSKIVQQLNQIVPPRTVLRAFARVDPFPSIAGPTPPLAPPDATVLQSAAVRRAKASVVRITAVACGLGVEGSGWVAAPGIVVTNAHVVAGERDTTVEAFGRPPQLSAYAIAFDPTNDIALLRVPGLGLPSLALVSDPPSGRAGAILGYPENGSFDAQPGRTGTTQRIITDDAYGHGPVSRLLTPLRGLVRPGNSGGPFVDRHGHVLATVFASTTGGGPAGGYGVSNATVSHVLAGVSHMVGTGDCSAG